jgi:hypothetical protein
MMSALDIGGTRARIYSFDQGLVQTKSEIELPLRQPEEALEAWGARRVLAIAALIGAWTGPLPDSKLPAACAGRKDSKRESVVESYYASPLPDLVPIVFQETGIFLGPLLDDDVCAGWGHLISPHGGLSLDSPDTVLLTAGTGLAECLWVGGRFLVKGTYPRLADLGLEAPLRAEAWRDKAPPLDALKNLWKARSPLGDFRRIVLSGRFATASLTWPARIADGVELVVSRLEEAPALGAMELSTHSALPHS